MSFYAVIMSFCILKVFNFYINLHSIIIHFQKYRMKQELQKKKLQQMIKDILVMSIY